MLTPRKKKIIVKEHGAHETDTGSSAVQVALLTRRIDELTGHLKKHSKDHHSRRGLLKIVGKRRRLLNYLSKSDSRTYNSLIKKLDLKK
ncbi:MAG: 30S ribosomal protein S15 [Candidatus Harrisonbacteria bacterium RIFCSPHIGHO2_01_FULL_44_13]|uniref:Small ribosomal subunit protein uS15 n=1 Tax=Candidatus Harrisonbacteria bacterium RIFCSPLOWO2_01_FULL_44_18 TaxID=1798407 RepID=A0A1G1ZPF8_9BACT|nr:MAG: 30S ribosomal protein S15 [Candidatus Harrisonbacteria bacterium RIFCSPHIGHO2_01_FULL_44_13]OGY65747.1 MAG: 30S ribosomal protein S15 [Candidatus Harrisonbacteria bacterium RIFCSPLOWO2_01_FULL_44_18]